MRDALYGFVPIYLDQRINGLFPGRSVCSALLVGTFLWWRKVYPYLQAFAGWLGKAANKCFSRSAYIPGFVSR